MKTPSSKPIRVSTRFPAFEFPAFVSDFVLRISCLAAASAVFLLTSASRTWAGDASSLYIDPAALRAPHVNPPLLVDVRSASDFATGHAPGAINVPLNRLRASRFLRGRDVVLIDEGWGDPVLEATCRRMRRDGFASVRILFGGAGSEPGLLSPREFATVRNNPGWVVIDASDPGNSAPPAPLLPRLNIPFDPAGAAAFADTIAAAVAERKAPARVLVMDRNGLGYAAIRQALDGRVPAPVFFLEGGVDAMEQQREAALAMRSPSLVRTSGGLVTGVGRLRVAGCGCR
jgi:hypothetical protein